MDKKVSIVLFVVVFVFLAALFSMNMYTITSDTKGDPGSRGVPGAQGAQGEPGSTINGTNGLHLNGTDIWLGGDLRDDTDINQIDHSIDMIYHNISIHNGLDFVLGYPGGGAKNSQNGYTSVSGVITIDDGLNSTFPEAVIATTSDDNSILFASFALPIAMGSISANPYGQRQFFIDQTQILLSTTNGSVNLQTTGVGSINLQSVEDVLIETTSSGVITVSSDAEVVIETANSGNITIVPDGSLIMDNIPLDNGDVTETILAEDANSVVYRISKSSIIQNASPPIAVFFDATSPDTATVFSLTNPPTVDDPSLHELDPPYYYIGSTGLLFEWDTGSSSYVSSSYAPNILTNGDHAAMVLNSAQSPFPAPSNPTHLFQAFQSYSGISVYANIATNQLLVRAGGIYEILVNENFRSSSAAGTLAIGIYVNGIIGSHTTGQIVSASSSVAGNTKQPSLIYRALVDATITVRTISWSSASPMIMDPESAISVKQIGFFNL
jgi:hypothetical protein